MVKTVSSGSMEASVVAAWRDQSTASIVHHHQQFTVDLSLFFRQQLKEHQQQKHYQTALLKSVSVGPPFQRAATVGDRVRNRV